MIELKDVNFQYNNSEKSAGITDINLKVKAGKVVLICGESGCGKTTLTRFINGLIPHYYEGQLSGEVNINGENTFEWPLYKTSKLVGSVFQNPRSQFFNIDTTSEIVFACENHGIEEEQIRNQLNKTIDDFKINYLRDRNIFDLSGGEKQKIACASASASEPQIMVLDEPSSNLDIKTTRELAKIIKGWKSEGKAVLIAEHRLFYLKDIADRIIFMKNGKIEKEYTMQELTQKETLELAQMGLRPLNLDSVKYQLSQKSSLKNKIKVKDFYYTNKKTVYTLNIPEIEINENSIIAVIGNNGSGKTTFAKILTGLGKKNKGKIIYDNKVYEKPKSKMKLTYMVMQDVNHQLFTESVLEEVMLSMDEKDEEKAESILTSLDLQDYLNNHPMSLSGGQKQRVAIACAIATNRKVIVFDEPTSGLDLKHMKEVKNLLLALKDQTSGVRIEAPANVLPEGAKMEVKPITEGSDFETSKTILLDVGTKFVLYDITILSKDNLLIQPNGYVKIYIPIPDGFDRSKIEIYRINEDGTKTFLESSIEGDELVFSTNHFSLYAVVERNVEPEKIKADISEDKKNDNNATITEKKNNTSMLLIIIGGIVVLSSAGIIVWRIKKNG